MALRYVFGPVHSGRLGLSLGLDLLGKRVCSFDCLYCEVGLTEHLTVQRAAYVPADRVLAELKSYSERGPKPEYVTLGGLGEPSLNTDMAEIIAGARKVYPDVPVAVLTNSSMLSLPEVRQAMAGCDVVLPSMDSLVPEEFKRLNRPHASLSLDAIRQGLLDFRKIFSGRIFLEILLVAGFNDSRENLDRLAAFRDELKPDRVDAVTLSRPGASPLARPVDAGTLNLWRNVLHGIPYGSMPGASAGSGAAARAMAAETVQENILGSLQRRPQTADQLSRALGLDRPRTDAALSALLRAGRLKQLLDGDEPFYTAAG